MKKINAKTSKRIVTVVLAAIAACSVMGCSVEKNVTRTETHTVTDADGNTTTTTVTNHNGEVTTETTTMTAEETAAAEAEEAPEFYSNVPLKIENNMDFDVAALNIKMTGDEEWSENFLSDDMVIAADEVATGINLSYDDDHKFVDVYMEDADGSYLEFDGVELPTNADEITFSFVCNADGTYTVNVI